MHGWCVLDTHPICIRNAHLNFSNDAHLDAFHMRIKNASMIPTLTLIQLIQDMRFQCISDAHQKCWNALMQCLKRFKCVSCSLGGATDLTKDIWFTRGLNLNDALFCMLWLFQSQSRNHLYLFEGGSDFSKIIIREIGNLLAKRLEYS